MCKFASFVLTKDQAFWTEKSNSHEDIIRENDLSENAVKVNIVRTEIVPTDSWSNLATWKYLVDQDVFPKWYDAADCERRTRDALRKRFGKAPWPKIFAGIDRFLAEIKTVRWFRPDGKPIKSWKLYVKPTWTAAWDATWAAARDAASAAAWAAAGAAAWAAAGAAARAAARAAAWDAARDAARDEARAAAGAAAWDAARDAAGAAGLYLQVLIICDGLKIDPKHIKHAKDRWRVWQKGYGLLCDVNGVLYVYGIKI